jgi:inward rectifier potassium channel
MIENGQHHPLNDYDETNDLGFGSRVAQESRTRLLNRDGGFNVRRRGVSFFRSLALYHTLLTVSWPVFYAVLALSFLLFNTLFAFSYLWAGDDALRGITEVSFPGRLVDAFFFSVQTSTTIGYGHIFPQSMAANILASMEVMIALLGFALATGLLFARVSRPNAHIIFSRSAIIAPYRGITALEFRIANERRNELIEVQIEVVLSRVEDGAQGKSRKFYELNLEREGVLFFPLSWTIVHPIAQESPLHGITEKEFLGSDPEILILLTGTDETFSQKVHARTSYKGEEVVWGARFAEIFDGEREGVMSVNLERIHDVESTNVAGDKTD